MKRTVRTIEFTWEETTKTSATRRSSSVDKIHDVAADEIEDGSGEPDGAGTTPDISPEQSRNETGPSLDPQLLEKIDE